MQEISQSIKLKCLFCFSEQFVLGEEVELCSGDQVVCASCGRSNDFDSLMRVAQREAIKIAEDVARGIVDQFFEKL